MSDPKIKYDIEAAVKGEQSVEALASKLRELGDVLEGDGSMPFRVERDSSTVHLTAAVATSG